MTAPLEESPVARPERPPGTELRVGRLTKAHGLKGALKLDLYTDDPARRFVPGATFALQVPDSSPWHGQRLELVELKWFNGVPVGFFAGVTDRTAAEGLVKAVLWVEVGEEPQEEDAWYYHQLVGLRVLRDGVELGRVVRVDELPAQDLLAVETAHGEVLVPFVKAIVTEVDVAGGTVTVDPPGGLFEEPGESGAEAAGETP
ncbi:MAG: ribosome maturation factor RimM [Micrococcales bacterium 73-13]|nr:MAG: ribosome maturation factor RimM [Micrococcales bacterium 73-13]